jgi:hypothetical protein
MVPRNAGADLVLGDTLRIDGDFHGAGREIHNLHKMLELVRFELGNELFAKGIAADGAHGDGIQAKLCCMVGEVGRSPAKLLARGEVIP